MTEVIIDSILDKTAKATHIETVKVDALINGYKNQFNIDVKKYFKSLTEIYIYECESTKLRFYYPFDIDGDSDFYEQLQTFDWYYMPWKWEHETTKNLLKGDETILEVGSGDFGFVEKMHISGCNISGLELNKSSIQRAKRKGFHVFEETIEAHAQSNYQKYDVVCSFQVLEHVTSVNTFISAKVDCLKPGGKLIIAVPNNDSFIKYTKNFMLNSPPHHMVLWNSTSLMSVANLFSLKVERVYYEPLQKYHTESYLNLMIQEHISKTRLLKAVFYKLKLKKLLKLWITKNRNRIRGHSMLIVYTKL